jgi:hypothetical protein
MRLIILMACVLISGCQQLSDQAKQLPPPEAFVRSKDRLAARMLRSGIPWSWPCIEPITCVKFDGPKRIQGLWRNDFEGSQFCGPPAKTCSYRSADERSDALVWLDFASPPPGQFKPERPGGLYQVDFVGRASRYPGIYGHLGVFDGEVIVDRMIAMTEIEAPPPPPTKAEEKEWARECDASPTCFTNDELNTMGWNKT